MSRDDKRFVLVLLAVIAVLVVVVVVRSYFLGQKSHDFDRLLRAEAKQAEFQRVLGPPDRKNLRAVSECWWYEFDNNPRKMVCFSLKSGDVVDSTYMWVD
ncbi:MAG: hypothetical protein K8J08_02830 [Thermoanaerobaculia bacterium]|nr:hypothetical protein [Thermoanaerobaculia bacterium]